MKHAEAKGAAPVGDAGDAGEELPTLDFATFILSMIGTAYVHLATPRA